jgi:hypothetical protein
VLTLPPWLPGFTTTQGLPPTLPPGRTPPFAPTLLLPNPKSEIRNPKEEPEAPAEMEPAVPLGSSPPQPVLVESAPAVSDVPFPGAARHAPEPVSDFGFRISDLGTTWEPLPDPFVGALAETEQETDAEREALAQGLTAVVAAEPGDTGDAPPAGSNGQHDLPLPESAPNPDVPLVELPQAQPPMPPPAPEPAAAASEPEPAAAEPVHVTNVRYLLKNGQERRAKQGWQCGNVIAHAIPGGYALTDATTGEVQQRLRTKDDALAALQERREQKAESRNDATPGAMPVSEQDAHETSDPASDVSAFCSPVSAFPKGKPPRPPARKGGA